MKVRLKNTKSVGESSEFTKHTLSEVTVYWEDDMDTHFISDLEVYLEIKGEWVSLDDAFGTGYLIQNNLNTSFREPQTLEEKERGYYYD